MPRPQWGGGEEGCRGKSHAEGVQAGKALQPKTNITAFKKFFKMIFKTFWRPLLTLLTISRIESRSGMDLFKQISL